MGLVMRHFYTLLLFTFLFINTLIAQNLLQKTTGEYNIHGTIRGTNAQGLEGIEVKRILYNNNWPLEANTSTTYTNSLGEFNTIYTGIDEIVTIENLGQLTYYWNKIESPKNGSVTVSNILGQELFTQEISAGNNIINLDNYANGIYFTTTTIDEVKITNKLVKVDETYPLTGKVHKEILKETKQTLEKTTDEAYNSYGFHIKDPTGQHYTHQFQPWNGWILDSTDISHSVPLLEKKNLDIPFTNPRNGEIVNTTKDALFYLRGIDILVNASQLPIEKPWRAYLNIESIPLTYSEQEIRNATLEMISSVGLPVDTTFYKEVQTRTPIGDDGSSYINYKFLPTSDPEMGDYDLIINYIVNASKHTASLEFYFNIDRIEPEHIGDFVKHAWWQGVVAATENSPTAPGYFSYDPRDSVRSMTQDENKLFTYLALIEKENG